MANAKVVLNGVTLIDLTYDTIIPDAMLAGYTAHDQTGEQINGTIGVITNEDIDEIINSWR